VATLLRLLAVLAALYVGVVGLVWALQRRLQYLPDPSPPRLSASDSAAGLHEVELVASDGVRLLAWHLPGPRPLAFLLLHGNAGHRGDRLPWIRALGATGASVLAVDYRGYGGSGGSPSEDGLLSDAEAGARWLDEQGAGALVVVGESLGSGVAVGLAARHPAAALVLVSAFPSLVPIARKAYPWLPVGLLMRDSFECSSKLAALDVPVLFVHGEADTIVPVTLGRALFEAAGGPKEWWALPGADHNDLPYADLPAFVQRVESFLDRHGIGPAEVGR
jgi:fermentation-respiration switch protein FrsA (DUF1100 family)